MDYSNISDKIIDRLPDDWDSSYYDIIRNVVSDTIIEEDLHSKLNDSDGSTANACESGLNLHIVRWWLAALFFGIAIGIAFIPLIITSLIAKKNIFIEIFSRMDGFWTHTPNNI